MAIGWLSTETSECAAVSSEPLPCRFRRTGDVSPEPLFWRLRLPREVSFEPSSRRTGDTASLVGRASVGIGAMVDVAVGGMTRGLGRACGSSDTVGMFLFMACWTAAGLGGAVVLLELRRRGVVGDARRERMEEESVDVKSMTDRP